MKKIFVFEVMYRKIEEASESIKDYKQIHVFGTFLRYFLVVFQGPFTAILETGVNCVLEA